MNEINSTLRAQWQALEKCGPLDALERAGTTRWTIDGIVADGSINWLIAAPESFKTFVALDMATCIANGRDWHGRATDQSIVVYLAAEGGNDIHVRRAAADIAAGETGLVGIQQSRPRLDDETGLNWLIGHFNDFPGPHDWFDEFQQASDFIYSEGVRCLSPDLQKEYDDLDGRNPKHKNRIQELHKLNYNL